MGATFLLTREAVRLRTTLRGGSIELLVLALTHAFPRCHRLHSLLDGERRRELDCLLGAGSEEDIVGFVELF